MKTNPKYKEIIKLHEMLDEAKIPHEFQEDFGGYHIFYPAFDNGIRFVCSAIENSISYGCENDLIEIMGLLTPSEQECDSVVGWLTAEDVFSRIENHYNNLK